MFVRNLVWIVHQFVSDKQCGAQQIMCIEVGDFDSIECLQPSQIQQCHYKDIVREFSVYSQSVQMFQSVRSCAHRTK